MLEEQANHGQVTLGTSLTERSGSFVVSLVDGGAPSQHQPDYGEVSFWAGPHESRASIMSWSINSRSRVEKKLSYSFVTHGTSNDKRRLSIIRCSIHQ
jgi:hypothetical protein